LSGNGINQDILWGDAAGEPEGEVPTATINRVSPGFFETLQTRMLNGRDFDEHDTVKSPKVVIVNETFTKKFAKGTNPVGLKFRIRSLGTISTPYEVIGLVKDTKYGELREEFRPIAYTAIAQHDHPETDAQILMRSHAPLVNLMSAVKSTASAVNPNMDISFVTFHKMIEEGLLRDRLMARLSGFFGLLAVVLAVVGLYGVISYMVARRRNEIAIRVALGAKRESILKLVMGEAGALLAVGLAIGTVLALAGGKAAASMLFGLKPWDVATFALGQAVLALVATAASLLPAARAARADPMEALRQE
jgi:putative ABC transport system permease protein